MSLSGFGKGDIGYGLFGKNIKTDLIPTLLRQSYLAKIEIKADKPFEQLMGQVGGSTKTLAHMNLKEDYTLTVEYQLVDPTALEIFTGEKWTTSTNIDVLGNGFGISQQATLNSSGVVSGTTLFEPFTGKAATDVLVYLIGDEDTRGRQLTVTTGTPTVNEIKLDASGNTLTNVLLANKGILISNKHTISSAPTIGVSSVINDIGNLDFVGVASGPLFPDGILIKLSGLRNATGFTWGAADTKSPVSLEMKASVTPGKRTAFQLIDLTGIPLLV